jgi:hypothetical protein
MHVDGQAELHFSRVIELGDIYIVPHESQIWGAFGQYSRQWNQITVEVARSI